MTPDPDPPLDEAKIKEYEALIAENNQRQNEAGQEFDKQTVYIAGGGLALTLTVAKDFISLVGSHYFVLLLLTWLCFSLTLLLNLISHRLASRLYAAQANLAEIYRSSIARRIPIDDTQEARETQAADRNSRYVGHLNTLSFITVTAGMSLLIIYVFFNALTMNRPAPTPNPSPHPRPDKGRGVESPRPLRPTPPPQPQPKPQTN